MLFPTPPYAVGGKLYSASFGAIPLAGLYFVSETQSTIPCGYKVYCETSAKTNTHRSSMKTIPATENVLVLRTDFSDQAAWLEICAELRKPVGTLHFLAYIDYLNDVEYADITKEQLLKLLPSDYNHSFIIVADQKAMTHPEHPLLIIDLVDTPAREFRAVPSQIQGIQNNLSIANMDFKEFTDAADEDGIFRKFSDDSDAS
jgi:hypothetical protein